MFGIAVARLDIISPEEKQRYQALYCGLCLALKQRYGRVSRAVLSYDLTFLTMLYDSLYEPPEHIGETRCIAHPRKKMRFVKSPYVDYCADLSVLLAYHKCLDDIADDRSPKGYVAAQALAKAHRQAQMRIPNQAFVVAETMSAIREMERDPNISPDATSIAFGDMLAMLIECIPGKFPDIWSQTLRKFGRWLGQFILLMDAAVDLQSDKKTGAYNPFLQIHPYPTEQEMRDILGVPIGRACQEFERLPCVQDDHLMRSILYSGVWQKFNQQNRSSSKGKSTRANPGAPNE